MINIKKLIKIIIGVMLISMVCSKGSISINGSIKKPIKPSATAADIPDALQPAKIVFFPCDEFN